MYMDVSQLLKAHCYTCTKVFWTLFPKTTSIQLKGICYAPTTLSIVLDLSAKQCNFKMQMGHDGTIALT